MVSGLTITFIGFTMLFTLFMPIIVAILFYKKEKYFIGSLFSGVLIFFLFQIVLRIPILQVVLPQMGWYQKMAENIWLYAIFLGLTAGIFEEVGRFIAFKTILKNRLEWKNGVAYGIGHGGIECILLIGLTYVNNFIMSIMLNTRLFDKMVAPTLPAETVATLKDQFLGLASYIFLVPSFERTFTMFIHIGLSLFVMVGIQKGKGVLYLIGAILLHMLIDTPVVILSMKGVNVWVIECVVFLMAIIGFLYIRHTKPSASTNESLQ